MSDLRFAFRQLLKSPGFTAVAVLSMGLGIGANTTVFSWVQGVLLHPLTGTEQADELVTLETIAPSGEFIASSYPDYRDYRDQADRLGGLIAFQDRPLILGEQSDPEWVWSECVSGNFFDVLRVRPAAGRFFQAEEGAEQPGAHPVVVISHGLWTRRFRSDPGIVGRTIKLNRTLFTVVGVAPDDFKGTIVGLSYDVWVPLLMEPALTGDTPNWLENRSARPLHLMARLGPRVSLAQANAQVTTISRRLATGFPGSNAGIGARLQPISKAPYGAQSVLAPLLEILSGVCAVVLLIVCANVANMLLARAASRQREISIRLAVGASRLRLLRQCLTESVLLALLGGALGVVLSCWMVNVLNLFIPPSHLPVSTSLHLDGRVLVFTLLVSVAAGLILGLAPALQATETDVHQCLKEGGRSGTGSPRAQTLRRALVVSEVALALVALIGAGLFVKSFEAAQKLNPGFDPENVLLVGLHLSASHYSAAQGKVFYREFRQRLEALPGVKAVSYAEDVPLGFDGGSWEDIQVDGYVPAPSENMKIYRNLIGPGYFDLMRIPLLDGRDFRESDDAAAAPVVIINEAFARRFLRERNPVGCHIQAWGRTWTVIGVAKDGKYRSLRGASEPYLYLPFAQTYSASTGMAVHVRTAVKPESLLPAVRRELQAMDANVAVFAALPLKDYIGAAYFMQRIAATLLSVLGGLALLLAALGLYSVTAYSVAQRIPEFGIRMALGACPQDLLRLVVRQGFKLACLGIGVGVLAGGVAARLISGFLYGTSGRDPIVFGSVAALLAGVTLLACYVPARRASRTDPMQALRYE